MIVKKSTCTVTLLEILYHSVEIKSFINNRFFLTLKQDFKIKLSSIKSRL